MDADAGVGGFGVGGCWEDDAKRSVCHNNQISGVLALQYIRYLPTSKHK